MVSWENIVPFVVFGVIFLDALVIFIFSKLKKKYAVELERLKGSRSVWITISELMFPLGLFVFYLQSSNSLTAAFVVGIFALMNAAIIVSFYDIYRAKKLSVKS